MMLLPGVEEEYIEYINDRTRAVDEHHKEKIDKLTPGTSIK